MNTSVLHLIPILAGMFGIGFLFLMFREARTQVRARRSNSECADDLFEPDERWSTRNRGGVARAEVRNGFDTVESALTLSFTVVCFETLCFLAYLHFTTPPETEGMLRIFRGNALCYLGLSVVIVAGFARFKKIWK